MIVARNVVCRATKTSRSSSSLSVTSRSLPLRRRNTCCTKLKRNQPLSATFALENNPLLNTASSACYDNDYCYSTSSSSSSSASFSTWSVQSLDLPTKRQHCSSPNIVKSRAMSSSTSYLPEFVQNVTIWGGSGFLLKALHTTTTLPYWACMSVTNLLVRISLIPLVLQGAYTSAKLATVAPEIQFLISIFNNDLIRMKEQKSSAAERFVLMKITWKSLRQIYRLHEINPLAIFKSPLMQIPVFWYFSVDIRKIINGADPALAQELTDSSFFYLTDLTEPDPWYGLPILSGLLLYLNVELAIGRKSLSGKTAAKSNLAQNLKDFFQTLAVFMPCFMSHSPAGVQIYLATSFLFTMVQSAVLRYDPFRDLVGLPRMNAPLPEGRLAKEFMELKRKEKEAIMAREQSSSGDDYEGLGEGVLSPGWQTAFPGNVRPSTINIGPTTAFGTANDGISQHGDTFLKTRIPTSSAEVPKVVSVSPLLSSIRYPNNRVRVPFAPPEQQQKPTSEEDSLLSQNSAMTDLATNNKEEARQYMVEVPENLMEAANRGERVPRIVMAPGNVNEKKKDAPLNMKQFAQKKKLGDNKKGLGKKSPARKK